MATYDELTAEAARLEAAEEQAAKALEAAVYEWECANPSLPTSARLAILRTSQMAAAGLCAEYVAALRAGTPTPKKIKAIATGPEARWLAVAQARMAELAEGRRVRKESYAAAIWPLMRLHAAAGELARQAQALVSQTAKARAWRATDGRIKMAALKLMREHDCDSDFSFSHDDTDFAVGFDGDPSGASAARYSRNCPDNSDDEG